MKKQGQEWRVNGSDVIYEEKVGLEDSIELIKYKSK